MTLPEADQPYPRRLHDLLQALLVDEPVIQVVGPRSCGKSFTCGGVIEQLEGTVLRLDDPAELQLARADPTGYLEGRKPPVLVDEYQYVPDLKAVIKSRLSATAANPGQYVLTGSVNADLVGEQERLTGRLHRARMYPLSEIEYRGLDTFGALPHILYDHRQLRGWRDPEPMTSLDYLTAAARGGFPLAVRRDQPARSRWFRDYIQDTVLRDALDYLGIRKPDEMLRLVRFLAARSAQVFKPSSLANDLDLTLQTIAAYQEILAGLFIVDQLPAWKSNRSQRLIKSPKLHITDTGLCISLLGLDIEGLRRAPHLAGHILESFVYNELAKQASWHPEALTLLHFSESSRAEVDIVVERPNGQLLGIEVKLADHVGPKDLAGLRRLRELAGNLWLGGVVLAAVPGAISPQDDDLLIAPISALWAYAT